MIGTPPRGHVLFAGTPTGPCVVFVHGLEDSWHTWIRVAQCLGSRWRAIALDLPWRAGNDYHWRWAGSPGDWVRAGLDACADRPCALVGHSFGANAILGLLAAREPRARLAVLAAPFFRPPQAPVTWKTFDLSRQTFERQISDGMRVGLRKSLPSDIFDVMLARTCERIGPLGFLAAFEEYIASGHLPLSHVDIPVLILAGENDPTMYWPHMEGLANALMRGTVACKPEFDHFCHIRAAPDVAQVIEDFSITALVTRASREDDLHAEP
jgi:pimeloyl-ACP methyl ester carboxylesterase